MHLFELHSGAALRLAVGFGLAACGIVAGLVMVRAPRARYLAAPIIAVPVALIAACAWAIVLGLTPAIAVLLGRAGTAMVGAGILVGAGLCTGLFSVRRAPRARVWRGTVVLDATGARLLRGRHGKKALRFAGEQVPAADEAKHFKLLGTTGTGKSTAIRELLAGALRRGDAAVIADPDGGYLDAFYEPGRGDALLNPFDARSRRWDLFGELAADYDSDLVARALIAEHAGDERTWRVYARVFLASLLRQLRRAGERDVATLHRLIVSAPVAELALLLDGTAAGPYLSADNARFFASIRAVATTQLAALEHLGEPRTGATLSVRRWVREVAAGSRHGALFLPYRAGQAATLRNLISTWMRLAIFETMEQSETDHRLWFVIDELDALGAIDGLKDALARLRKFGGRCVLGLQSIAQITGTYGPQDAQTIIENCGNTLILRCSASESGGTARFASRLIGDREVVREQVTRASGGALGPGRRSRSITFQHVTEPAVLAAEIEQLPDLAGYLKFASAATWRRIEAFGTVRVRDSASTRGQ